MSSSDESEYKEVIQEDSNESESETQSEKPADFEETVGKHLPKKRASNYECQNTWLNNGKPFFL